MKLDVCCDQCHPLPDSDVATRT